jgi:hypothetical protein
VEDLFTFLTENFREVCSSLTTWEIQHTLDLQERERTALLDWLNQGESL